MRAMALSSSCWAPVGIGLGRGVGSSRGIFRMQQLPQESAKHNLLRAVVEMNRGLRATSEQRALVEEAMVEVEKYNAGTSLDLRELDGTWLLRYTTAPDVVSILHADSLPFFELHHRRDRFIRSSNASGDRTAAQW